MANKPLLNQQFALQNNRLEVLLLLVRDTKRLTLCAEDAVRPLITSKNSDVLLAVILMPR
ncbi:hypothetical protein TTHERM_001068151 (macronuclear) [Tetrahymena thermophila SB210]|uniref:Uncharacterized protein n=1 Tax=Tetrahymena thermophila (strain SB210) TaxID=312017 RepID=W7X8P8_TETTS|nr:hypothetical protein TTHERM_001068151 [Tetrahymena thermophila SB210]EWS72778.1 hypothetical protein TTHERM_001068151 [Tetrahymena thermophila SB210]|eukprot:XP_012654690.1 hypothetical protein TTHERM_001068151 [Tetrahymena thermophila SB210]